MKDWFKHYLPNLLPHSLAHSPTFAAASLQGKAVRAPAGEAQEEVPLDSKEEVPFPLVELETAIEFAEDRFAFETVCTEVTI